MISLFIRINALPPASPCELWFESVNGSCICNRKLNSNGTFCAPNCSDFDEIELNGICVPKMVRKSTDADGCGKGSIKTNDCVCDSDFGWEQEVGISEFKCTTCYTNTMVSDGVGGCTACLVMYGVDNGVEFDNNAPLKCAIRHDFGFAGQIKDRTTFSATYPFLDCWGTQRVVSADGLTCVSCNQKYGLSTGLVFNATAYQYHCSPDAANGLIGVIDNDHILSQPLVNCWLTSQVVKNNQCVECNTINKSYVFDTLTYSKNAIGQCREFCDEIKTTQNPDAPLTCMCNYKNDLVSLGEGQECFNCKQINAHAFPLSGHINIKYTCQCNGLSGYGVLKTGDKTCSNCNQNDKIASLQNDNYVCVSCDTGYIQNNNQCVKEVQTRKSIVTIAVAVPVSIVVIVVIIIFLIWLCKKQKKENKNTKLPVGKHSIQVALPIDTVKVEVVPTNDQVVKNKIFDKQVFSESTQGMVQMGI
ncbi:Hypothetical_protein [Hexamita inflata]|uniref:Hypothetical_protein n=1 Tax=Hexamita inflata TaxID=28002 RepID=A0AA86QYD3_9EUKA|nr:Hypothetical protein HINF_LOCUS51131 [Hexamita inflata]